MIRVALRGLAGRKLRAFLTALAIVLGVAMVSGTFVLTDMIDRAFDDIFTQSYANTDAYISGKAPDFTFEGDQVTAPSIPASLLPTVKKLPDVRAAGGTVADESATKIIDRKGKPITTGGAPTFGFGLDYSLPQFNPLQLTAGRWPSKPDDVVIDSGTAGDQNYKVGDTIRVATLKPVRPFKLVGIAQYGSVGSIGSATFATFTLPTAQELLDRKGKLDAISVSAKSGVSQDQLVAQIKQVVPLNKVEVRTQAQQVKEAKKSASFTKIIKYFLLSFATIALFVGAFVIFNTLSITVSQRIREFATLRTIGASRRQILTSVTIEAFVIGLVGAIIGLFAGIGLAVGLNAFFKAVNSDLPTTGLIVAPRTVIISLLIGVVITLVAGLAPAVKATKVPPIAAVREGATLPPGRLAPFLPFIAVALVALAVALLAYGMFVDTLSTPIRLLSLALGCLVLFIGVALLSPRLVPTLSRLVRPIAKWVMLGSQPAGVSDAPRRLALPAGPLRARDLGASANRLARRRARRAPRDRAGRAIRRRVGDALSEQRDRLGLHRLDPGARGRARRVGRAGCRPAAPWTRLRQRQARRAFRPRDGSTFGREHAPQPGPNGRDRSRSDDRPCARDLHRGTCERDEGVEPAGDRAAGEVHVHARLGQRVRLDLAERRQRDREGTGGRSRLERALRGGQGIGLGTADHRPRSEDDLRRSTTSSGNRARVRPSTISGPTRRSSTSRSPRRRTSTSDRGFSLLTPKGDTVPLEVKGVYKAPPFYPLLGEVSISLPFFDTLYERPQNLYTFLDVKGTPSDTTQAALERDLTNFPDAQVQTRDEWIDAQDQDFDNFLLLLYVLLALAVIVSLVGMINTLVLSVFERTRELGMLRAVGMTRHQVSRMVRQESVITALIGAALGLPLGVFLAVLVTRALSQFNVEFVPPWKNLIGFAIVAMIAGVLAAVAPARRASRLNVLRALQYE